MQYDEKQYQAEHEIAKLSYMEIIGPLPHDWAEYEIGKLTWYLLDCAYDKVTESIKTAHGVAANDEIPPDLSEKIVKAKKKVFERFDSNMEGIGEMFLYSNIFPSYFQSSIGKMDYWEIRPFLNGHCLPDSRDKFKLLDDKSDYEYLSDILHDALSKPDYKKASLELGLEWINKTVNELWSPPVALIKPVKWKGPKANFTELAYALIESKSLEFDEGERAKTVTQLAKLFSIDLPKPESSLQTIGGRKTRVSVTPFLDRLRDAFSDFLERS